MTLTSASWCRPGSTLRAKASRGNGVEAPRQAHALGVYGERERRRRPDLDCEWTAPACAAATVVPIHQRLQSLRMPANTGQSTTSVSVRRETSPMGG